MSGANHDITVENLPTLEAELLAKAQDSTSRRAAITLHGGRDSILRQTILALAAGAELTEHESPPEATLQLLAGNITLHGDDREWKLTAGDHITIPPERHSVTAETDTVFLLTAIRAAAQ